MKLQQFITELKRRNVFRVATAYAIAGWLIIQIVTVIEEPLALPDSFDTIIIVLVSIGFPLILLFAWAFELTPDGIKKSVEVDITESVTHNTGKKINKIIISVLSVLVFFLLTERVFFAHSNVQHADDIEFSQASIAVLPFADLSPEGDQEYFSDGLSEELLNVLAKEQDMKVAGRTSSFKFKGQNENLTLIGSELGVNHILEGSVRKAGNTIRITAQLIKVNDGFHMWSETYDREYTAENIFRIQDEISQMVLNELKVRLLPEDPEETIYSTEKLPTADIEAYEAFLKGNQLVRNREIEDIDKAIDEYERAIDIDPNFAMAYARLAIGYFLRYEYGNVEKDEIKELIRRNADKALFIDPTNAFAYASISRFYAIEEDLENELEAIEKAHQLSPNNPIITNWFGVSNNGEDNDKRDSLYLAAYELDPLHPVIAVNTGGVHYFRGDYDLAEEIWGKNIETNPDYLQTYISKIRLVRMEPNGNVDEAFIISYNGYKSNPEKLSFIQQLQSSANDFDLDSLWYQLNDEILRLFPNNPNALNAQIQLKFNIMDAMIDNLEYEEAKVYAEENLMQYFEEDSAEFQRYINTMESWSTFNDHFENREFQKAFEIIQESYPEYLTDTLTTHPEYNMETLRIKYLFKQVGRADLVQNLDKLEFEFLDWVEFRYNKDISKEAPSAVYQLAMESLYNNDVNRFITIIEELYFNRKYKLHDWHTFFDKPDEIEVLESHPELQQLIDRIEADKNRMKDNVVAFLKEEGVWKNSWETVDED